MQKKHLIGERALILAQLGLRIHITGLVLHKIATFAGGLQPVGADAGAVLGASNCVALCRFKRRAVQ